VKSQTPQRERHATCRPHSPSHFGLRSLSHSLSSPRSRRPSSRTHLAVWTAARSCRKRDIRSRCRSTGWKRSAGTTATSIHGLLLPVQWPVGYVADADGTSRGVESRSPSIRLVRAQQGEWTRLLGQRCGDADSTKDVVRVRRRGVRSNHGRRSAGGSIPRVRK